MSSQKKKKSSQEKNSFLKELKVDEFFNQRAVKIAIPIIFLIIALYFVFLTRIGPVSLSGLDDRIEANTYNQILSIIEQDVNAEFPNLNQIYKQELIQERFEEALGQGFYDIQGQRLEFDSLIQTNIDQVKGAFQAENGQTYLNAIDPYHFQRLSYLYHMNGYVGDELREVDGEQVPYLSYKLAPNGIHGNNPSLHVWLEAQLYALNGIDETSTFGEKTKAIFILPVLLVMLAIIPIFFILRLYTNDLLALFGSLFMASIGTFVSRTVAGFVDTDPYNVLFPLLISVFLIYGIFYSHKKYLTYGLFILAGLFQGLFLWAWEAGWFIFIFSFLSILAYEALRFIAAVMDNTRTLQNNIVRSLLRLVPLVLYTISSWIFVFVFTARGLFDTIYNGIFTSLSGIAGAGVGTIWPNVFSSVAELNPASFGTIVGSVGGSIAFILAMVGLLLLTLDYNVTRDNFKKYNLWLLVIGTILFITVVQTSIFIPLTANTPFLFLAILFAPIAVGILFALWNKSISSKIFLVLLLSSWMAGTVYMSLNGVRFILLLGPAFAIAFAVGLFYIAKYVNSYLTREIKLKGSVAQKVGGFVLVFVVFAVLFHPMATNALNISNNTLPNFDDAWYSSMIKIKDSSEADAIITSWWDFGHFFSAVAERGVTFDGGSQTTPQSHWVGKLLFESDEQISLDILRMISCGGNNAFELMLEYSQDPSDGVLVNKIIYDTFGLSADEKREVISSNSYFTFTSQQVDEIMEELHCTNPPENFLITSGDMVGKAPVWSHWGTWDFTRKFVHDNYQSMSVSEMAILVDENETVIDRYVSELRDIDTRSETENIRRLDLVNQWFSPYYSYVPVSGALEHGCVVQNDSFSCMGGGIQINQQTGRVTSTVIDESQISSLVYPTPELELRVVPQFEEGQIQVVLIPSAVSPRIVLVQNPMGESLFTKLYYLNGIGVDNFELFDDVQSVSGTRVITWRTNFNETETSLS